MDITNIVLAEYIWLGGSSEPDDLRGKTKTLYTTDGKVSLDDLPIWNYDGSSTNQAEGSDSEVYLKPVVIYRDPFRGDNHILVLCESVNPDTLKPIESNTRHDAVKLFNNGKSHEPWFGIEQEYTLFNKDGITPLGWPVNGYPKPQGPYYCGVGSQNVFGRHIVEAHYLACLKAGLTMSGINAEVMPGQWEYQVGPCTGIDSGDMVVMSRYILLRICEQFGVVVSFDPKPKDGDWNGSGCHTNFSTKAMREDGGYRHIMDAITRLKYRHVEHMHCYGSGNDRRLTGKHETAPMNEFSFGVADRKASVRIGRQTHKDGKGYFEDRRPASNMNPYLVTKAIFKTCCLG